MRKVLCCLALCALSCGGRNFETFEGAEQQDGGDEGGIEEAGIEGDVDAQEVDAEAPDDALVDSASPDVDVDSSSSPPLAWWRFDGNGLDSSGNGHHLAFTDVHFDNGAVVLKEGSVIQSSTFGPVFRALLGGSFTIFMRIRVDDLSIGRNLLMLAAPGDENVATNRWGFQLRPPDFGLHTETGLGENHFTILGKAPINGRWTDVEVHVDGDWAECKMDGSVVGGGNYVPAETTADIFYVGSSEVYTGNFVGAIDEVRVWL